MRVSDGDGLDRPQLELAVGRLLQMHARHQSVVAADALAVDVGGAGMQEIAEAVEDERVTGDLDAAYDVGVVADDEIDAVLLRR